MQFPPCVLQVLHMDQTTAFSFLDEVSHEARKPLAGDGLSARERDMAGPVPAQIHPLC